MANSQLAVLQAERVTKIMQALQDIRNIPQTLRFLGRTPVVNELDDQAIMARFQGRVFIADLIADDQAATVYTAGQFTYEANTIPNLKAGTNLNQSDLNQLSRMAQLQGVNSGDISPFNNWEAKLLDNLLLGVRQRMEALCVAVRIDGFSYDRLGIKMANVTWGMPSDLKVTPALGWDDTTSTPCDDILAVKLVGNVRYGINYNRATMSTACFRAILKTTEFQNKVRAYLAPNVSYSVISQFSLEDQLRLAQNVLGMVIELYDGRYWYMQADGTVLSAPFLPVNKVILEDSTNDGSENAFDFANGLTTESMVSSLMGGTNMLGGFTQPEFGPIAYPTSDPNMNPPKITYWGVARGFTRRNNLVASACLTVGNIVDPIPVTEPVQM